MKWGLRKTWDLGPPLWTGTQPALDASRGLWSQQLTSAVPAASNKVPVFALISQRAGAMRPDLRWKGVPQISRVRHPRISPPPRGRTRPPIPLPGLQRSYRPAAFASALGGPDAQ